MSELNELNEGFKHRLNEYKCRLSPKELKNIIDLEGVFGFFYAMGWTDSKGQPMVIGG